MAVVEIPTELGVKLPLVCTICNVELLISKATVGLLKADKTQAFACISHFWEVELLITGWADFLTQERREHKRLQDGSMDSFYGGGDAWLNS